MITLTAYRGIVSSPFGLLGRNENALTFALGYTLQKCPRLLQLLLAHLEIKGVKLQSLESATITLQRHGAESGNHGITDIEIHLPGCFHVIIEAKIGLDCPSIEQCAGYLPAFDQTREPDQRLVALVQSPDKFFADRYKHDLPSFRGKLHVLHWSYFLKACIPLMNRFGPADDAGMAVRWFYRFLDQEYRMKAFTTEVWILPTNDKPLWPGGWSYFDTHQKRKVYYDKQATVRPLYIAFRANGKIDSLYRVLRIEHECCPVKYVPELRNVKKNWPNKPVTIWHLDDPVKLPRAIPTGGSLWQRRVHCDMDVLLSSHSVAEMEKRMGERRKHQTG